MYKAIASSDFKKLLWVGEDYKVDKCIIYGTRNWEKTIALLQEVLPQDIVLQQFTWFFSQVWHFQYNWQEIWFAVCYGSSYTSEICHVASMLWSKENIAMGSCGGLQKHIESNTVIIPTYSHCPESSAQIYEFKKDNKYFPSEESSTMLKDKLEALGEKVHREPTTTCQAMLGETRDHILWRSKHGFGGVEMEAGTVFAVSNHFGVKTTALLQVADNLIQKETVFSESYNERRAHAQELRKKMIAVAIGI